MLSSPLLGPAAWEPVRSELSRVGWDVVVAAHAGSPPGSADEVAAAFVAALAPTKDWVLVPHSNAGLFAPVLARQRSVKAVVYVDARLPGSGRQPMSSAASLRFHAGLADDDGLLPLWSDWWDDDVGYLFPSPESRRRCESEMRRLPLSYFSSDIDGTGWDSLPSAYLAFGDVYAAERNSSVEAGFPVATIESAAHLHMLIDPAAVARHIEQLLAGLGVRG